jgi:KDO2-lipid IV(A) lauroyltransferase
VLDRFVYWSFRLTILLMRPLPLRLAYRVAGAVALLCYLTVFPRHRRALNRNLARVLQSTDSRYVDAVARQSFRNFGKYVIDFIHYPAMTPDEVKRRLRFEQFDELAEAANSGRGVLIVTLHYGNWDLGGAALASLGYPISVVAENFHYAPMNELVQGSRARLGMRIIQRERAGARVLRALRRGEMLAMLMDVTDGEEGVLRADFFGAPALVSSAPARIALHTGAWVVPSIVLRGPEDDLEIRPYIDTSLRDYAPTGDDATDVRALTALILRSLETRIKQHPDQWFIFRPLWSDDAPVAAASSSSPSVEGSTT